MAVGLAGPAHGAPAAELHILFETRCGRCHDHAGDLGRDSLAIADGVLVGRQSGRDIRRFLRRHHPSPRPADTEALLELLSRVVAGRGQFRDRCTICHGHARDLARDKLFVNDGRLVGRYTGHDIRAFLVGHGRLDASDAAFFHDLLLWQTAAPKS